MFVESYPNGNHITSATWHVSNHNSLTSNIIKPFSLHLHTVQAKAKQRKKERARKVRSLVIVMATSVMASVSLKPTPFTVGNTAAKGLPSLGRKTASFAVVASGGKKIKTDKPFGIGGGMDLREGLDASGRKGKGKGVYQFVDKYGANVDGYSPIYNEEEWSPTGDVYTGGPVGLAIWAVTLLGLLAGGALLVYNTSALSQ